MAPGSVVASRVTTGLVVLLTLVGLSACRLHEGREEEEERGHEFEVFHVEWERVSIPYIIALWILITSFAKIGKGATNCTYLPTSSF